MDYEGVNMWMLTLNAFNETGEMRFVSMDGQTTKTNISGLSDAHHDFTVLPGKIVTRRSKLKLDLAHIPEPSYCTTPMPAMGQR